MSASRPGTLLIGAGSVVILATVVAGLWTIGTPGAQREARMDGRRIDDLVRIEGAVRRHWDAKKALPGSLVELAGTPGLRLRIEDPDGGPAYEYRASGEASFELCATFSTDTVDDAYAVEQWLHGKGRHCFPRSIERAGARE